MISFIKRLFSQPESAAAAPTPVAVPPPIPVSTGSKSASTPSLPAVLLADGDIIAVPLTDIVSRLPGQIASRPSVASLTGTYPLPIKTAVAQLPSGAVRIRFAQLREAAPKGTFPEDATLDETLVDLPLQKILSVVNPALLARNAAQQQVEIPDDISGPFGLKENSSVRVMNRSCPPPPLPRAAAPAPAPMAAAAPAPTPVALPASIPMPAPVAIPLAAPVAPNFAPNPIAFAPASAPAAFVPPPMPSPVIPLPVPAAPAPVVIPAPTSVAPAGPVLDLKLSAVYEFWPVAIRQEITHCRLSNASVALPLDRVEAAMKTGRVVFVWGEIIPWLDAPYGAAASPQGDVALELPLKVIAPLFMAKRNAPAAPQKKIAISDSVPNLFTRAHKVADPAAKAPALTAAPAVPEAPAVPNVFGEVFHQPSKREWTPLEITQQINALPGVQASIVAMNDGFLVAGELPAPLRAETMAAFLPQMFGRLTHYTGEIHLGPLAAMTVLCGQSRCAIYKAGTVFLAVLGKPGALLPEAPLQRVAGELAEHNK